MWIILVSIDRKVIQKKRQDTLDMCRIFNEENDKIQLLQTRSEDRTHYKSRRSKRDVGQMKLGNPVLDEESAKRIESIVDKLYEDLDERVTYRQRILAPSTPAFEFNKTMRRFNFAPAELIHITAKPPKSSSVRDYESPGVSWHKKWKHGILPYFIDPKTYDAHLAELIIKAFQYFERATCIRLQRLRDKPTDEESMQKVEWLYITNPSGIRQCVHSNEKKENKGVQKIVFGYDCMSLGQIVHEIMHVLGFSHEHTRPDRDNHITILWNNIKPGYKKYFEKRTKDQLMNIPYDYLSVLHYPPRAFSKNGQITIMGQVTQDVRLGQREGLSETDVEKVTYIFGHECIERNKQYLLKTCPSVVRAVLPLRNISREDITNYFKNRLWPYGIINYKIKDKMEFTTEERDNIRSVISHIEKETCIRFNDITEKGISEDKDNNNGINSDNTAGNEGVNLDPIAIDSARDSENIGQTEMDGSGGGPIQLADSDGTHKPETVKKDGDAAESTRDNDEADQEIIYMTDGGTTETLPELTSSDNPYKSGAETNNEIVKSDRDKENLSPAVTDANDRILRKGKNKKQLKMRLSKIIKPEQLMNQRNANMRRHAENVLVFERSSEPGCACPPPGKPSGNAVLKLNADCFNSVNDLLHLFVHILGLDHQHNMHDRDDFLHIVWDNLTPEIKNEMKDKLPPAASVGFAYDYQSVMHYPWLQIKNGVTNMMYPIWNDGWAMGHWQGLSSIDVQKLNNLYFEQCVDRKKLVSKS